VPGIILIRTIQGDFLSPSWSKNRTAFELEDRSKIVSLWQERFGIPVQVFDGFCFYRRAQNVWAFSDTTLPKLSYEAIGLRMMNFKEEPWKPTSCALQVFGRHATKNIVHLTREQSWIFFAGKSQVLEAKLEAKIEPGYVVVFYNGYVLGCGLYSHGKLVSQIPKESRISGDTEMDI
jgi:NOL1/NOP2/fmu family ribosome biogenesis protein